MPHELYPRQCYMMLRSLTDAGKTTWASHMPDMLFEHAFGYAWIADTIGNSEHFLSIFTQRIKDISLQNWRRRINESPKADNYEYFKINWFHSAKI